MKETKDLGAKVTAFLFFVFMVSMMYLLEGFVLLE